MHLQKKQSSRFFRFSFFGFTLTELIVVITILAILSVIAFLSFQSYSASARDSIRVSDISNISKALSIFEVYSGKYPEPSGSTVMKFKGGSVWKQGIIGDDIIRATKILSEKPVDPKFSVPYTYSVTVSGNEYQLAGALE
jgi:prepilin-type N-terminal cleavage/methylation domain-containing protein